MKAIHRGNGPSWNRIINWVNTFIVAAFLFCTNSGFAGNSTNTLWLSLSGASNGWLTLTLNGTQPGSNYTLLSQTTLTASNWNAAGLVTGAQNQSWTAVQVPLTGSVWFVQAQYNSGGTGGGTNSGGNGGGTNSGTAGYGTNLWLNSGGVANGVANLAVVNSAQDIWYEIQGKTNLLQPDWISYGFVSGSELTNWTSVNLPVNPQGNLFLRIRSWADSYNSGIPDWWWLQYFGQITNVDAYASAANDGFSNLQKFQMGLNPTNYYNLNAPTNFFGYVVGSNAFIMWSPATGPVLNYAIQRGILNTNTGNYVYTQFLVSSNATLFEDIGAITNANAQNNIYNLEAVYPGGSFSGTNTWQVNWYASYFSYGPPYGPPMPGNMYAYLDSTGTNVLISWTPAQGPATSYIVERATNTGNFSYVYTPIAQVGSNVTSYKAVGALTNVNNWTEPYAVVAAYPGGGLSYAVPSYSGNSLSLISLGSNNGPAAPTNFFSYADWIYYPSEGGTNVYLTWSPSPGAVAYLIYGGVYDGNIGADLYQLLGKITNGATMFELAGGTDGNGNYTYSLFTIIAVYADGSLSQSASWFSSSGPPAPSALDAYVDSTGTNVVLSWSLAPGATGYLIQRSDYYGESGSYYQIAQVNANTTSFVDVDEVDNAPNGIDTVWYEVQAMFPDGGFSEAATAVSNAPPAPSSLSATVDATGTNVMLSWSPATGAVSDYIIERGVYNPATGTYSYSQIATVSASTTSYEDLGAITGNNSHNDVYEVIADYGGGYLSAADTYSLYDLYSSLPVTANLNLAAQMVRNGNGRWELVFSGIPANVQAIALNFYVWDYFYDWGPFTASDMGYPFTIETDIPVSSLTNGIYVIPDLMMTNAIANGIYFNTGGGWDMELSPAVVVSPILADGTYGNQIIAGLPPNDEPAFADGRLCLKQNLLFELRSATISQPNTSLEPADTNYVESSFFNWTWLGKGYGSIMATYYLAMDDLWPFKANYALHGNLYDPNYTGLSSFVWQTNVATIPAPAVLGVGDPYWISQPISISPGGTSINPTNGQPLYTPPTISISPDLAAYTNNGNLYLESGVNNLFGLAFKAALVNLGGTYWYWDGTEWVLEHTPIITIAPGGFTSLTNVGCFYSQTADPSLQLVNYYFAPVNTPGTYLVGETAPVQPYPLPSYTAFANTNQTGVMIASVGTPTVIGGWAKFSLQNSSKFAYLGQYYITNAFVMTNGIVTTITTGVVSPYGDFFPTQPGMVAMVTMPDIDTGAQGTGVVRVVSLCADANHDGAMDFSYFGPDQTSPSRPFRFWINDDQDDGDYGGNGIPGQGVKADGVVKTLIANSNSVLGAEIGRQIHGRRDLVDFFPVYLNVGSLFQSNALSAGISVTDTNYQFILSQADGALRFAYTDLTPTNYMNYLWDTVDSGKLAYAPLTTISNSGVALSPSFTAGIATNNQGIILVEAWESTTQPLVLTIYHGTNQIAQTQLYLSISGVEQMFRSKTMLLYPQSGTVPDRLTDASVPNEPDTIDKNFVFLHGYNVLPDEARGVASDMFKRMYWSGSHAKFYAVTWEGADTKGTFPFYNKLTPNYHTNVVNAFLTAPYLANFVASLTNIGPVVVSAHSLGNMVTLSAISDWNAPISQYFMLDAAVPIEAIDPTATTNMMIYSTWTAYSNRVFASDWYQLFPNNDARSTLFWNNRLGNLGNVDVYNFFSSGEEILRTYTTNPPPSVLGKVRTQITDFWPFGIPFGTYTWYWQEKGKGTCGQDWFLGSSHGGWRFPVNEYGDPNPVPPATANSLPNATLRQTPIFDFGSYFDSVTGPFPDLTLTNNANGSAYAQANRNRILSDAIPAMSLVTGANPVPSFSPPKSPVQKNFDMMTFRNGWPQGRTGNEANKWHHSDFHEVAYTFTYQLFNQFVTTGNLK
jgi:hypothetical protein